MTLHAGSAAAARQRRGTAVWAVADCGGPIVAEIARLRPRQIGFDLPLLATVRYARRRPRAEEARHAAD